MANPFTPGNGIEPAYLAGRSEYIEEFIKSLKSFEGGLPRNATLYGIRGTGKTVLLRHYGIIAEANDWVLINREFNERYCDESEFAQAFGKDLITAASNASIKKKITEAGKKLVDFLKPEELSAYGISYKPYYKTAPEPLEDYIKELLRSNWKVFKKSSTKGVVFLYDEFHLVKNRKEEKQYVLSSLLSAFSQVQREGCRYYLCLSGLPSLKTNLKMAKTYTERMFIFQEVENLEPEEAKKALLKPLDRTGYEFEGKLMEKIVAETQGYPYFIQFYGYFMIDNVDKKRMSVADLEANRKKLLKQLDKGFFEDRIGLASETEKRVLAAMAKCEGRDVSAGQIAKRSGMNYRMLQPYLIRLTDKGLIYRIRRGFYSFSLPLLRDYLLRQ